MVTIVLDKPETTIATSMIARLVQINVNLGVTKGATTTITRDNPRLYHFGWNFGYHINCKSGVDLARSVLKSCHPEVFLIPFLQVMKTKP